MTSTTPTARTQSLHLAAFVTAKGFKFLRCEPAPDGENAVFVFALDQDALNILEGAFLSNSDAPAYALLSSLKMLRRSLNSTLGRGAR